MVGWVKQVLLFGAFFCLAAPFALGACANQEPIVAVNQPPVVRIFAPIDGMVASHGDTLNLSGSCIDPEGLEEHIQVLWTSDLDGELDLSIPDEQGNVGSTVFSLSGGTHIITLTCTDEAGVSAADSREILVNPNEPPSVQIDEPDSGDSFTTDETITMQVTIRDDVDLPETLVVAIQSDLDGEVAADLVPDSNGQVVAVFALLGGSHLVEVRATDLEGGVGTSTVAVEVFSDHLPPDCEISEPLDEAFQQGESVLFQGQVNDPDVAAEELTVRWATDLDGEFAVLQSDSSGSVETWYAGLSVGDHILTMTAIDEENFECTADTPLRVCEANGPPDVTLVEPSAELAVAGTPVTFYGSAADDSTPADNLEVIWESDVDGIFNTDGPDAMGQLYFQFDQLTPGSHAITLRVDDTCGHEVTRSLTLLVVVDEDGDGHWAGPWGDDCDDQSEFVNPTAEEVPYDGIDQDCSGADLTDLDGDGYDSTAVTGGDDCDDSDPGINPSGTDVPYDGIDQDCSGYDAIDLDGDTYDGSINGVDCDDNNAAVNPGAADIPYNNIDEDCSGADLVDVDGDGFAAIAGGGTDCDDNAFGIYPGAPETPYDGIDQDCNGYDLLDADGDTFTGLSGGGNDCDDANPSVYPGAPETPYDGIDQDCSGADWDDVDGDGYTGYAAGGTDCDDNNPTAYPGSTEIAYDGVDQDCAGGDLVDVDGDSFAAEIAGGTDCDDYDILTNPFAADIPYDGIDQDCNGSDLIDVDNDGYIAVVAGGTDCNDYLPTVYPGAPEVPSDGLDNDCNGLIDDVTPTAVPDLDGNPYLCLPIPITGSGSYAPPGPPLTYLWALSAKPTGSTVSDADIADVTAMNTTFTPDMVGVFLLSLTVTQGTDSHTDFLVIDVVTDPTNQDPVANAGSDVSASSSVSPSYNYYSYVCPNCSSQTVSLNGSASSDPDGNPIEYQWTVISGNASVSSPTSATTNASLNGGSVSYNSTSTWTYTFQLQVTDCELASSTDIVNGTYSCSCN